VKGLVYIGVTAFLASAVYAGPPVALSGGGTPSAAAPPADGIGSVISSFKMSPLAEPFALGVYRDPSYVYGAMYTSGTDYLYRFTPGGARVSSFALNGTLKPRGADPAHLGFGYLSVVDADARKLYVFRTTGGSPVTKFSVGGSPYPLNCFWDGNYYYVNGSSDVGKFNRYTTAGAGAGRWTCAGWPGVITTVGGAAYAHRGNNGKGPYLVACSWTARQPMCMTTFPGGLLIRTWTVPANNGNGLAYGDSSKPGVYGAAVWGCWYTNDGMYATQFDVEARGAAVVVPVSLGKVKSLYR